MWKPNYLVVCWVALVEALMLVSLSTAVAAEEGKAAAAANEDRIRQVLTQPTSFEFVETPLVDAINFLCEKHEIPIQFDVKALSDIGIATDRPVSKELRGVSLRNGLLHLLRDIDLTYVIRDEVMLITTPDEAHKTLVRKTYDIHDLRPEGGYEKLVDVLTRHVKPTSWDTSGGAGSISYFTSNGIDALIVTQTEAIHDELSVLLADLRRLRKPAKDKQ